MRFLDLQLQSCEASVFTDPTFVGDVMAGLKGFVIKFMIRMSRVCTILISFIIGYLYLASSNRSIVSTQITVTAQALKFIVKKYVITYRG